VNETRQQIRNIVVRVLTEHAGHAGFDPAELSDDTDVLGSGIIDSLAFVELLMRVEVELETTLALDQLDFEQITDLGALVEALDQLALAG
jgi:acyl carrier protein